MFYLSFLWLSLHVFIKQCCISNMTSVCLRLPHKHLYVSNSHWLRHWDAWAAIQLMPFVSYPWLPRADSALPLHDCSKLCEIPTVLLSCSRIPLAGLPPAWHPWKWRPQGNALPGQTHLQWCCPEQELWRCLGLQLKGETEIYLPWGACPCWRYCLMKMCISQSASQTSHAPGCHSAPHSGRGHPAYLPIHKARVQMCWMCWAAPFRTICLQCREFP